MKRRTLMAGTLVARTPMARTLIAASPTLLSQARAANAPLQAAGADAPLQAHSAADAPLQARSAADPAVQALPRPDTAGGLPLEQALLWRRSLRSYTASALPLAALSQLLWAAQGRTDPRGLRTAPSAGALYPLELHLAALRVDGLSPGVYRYLGAPHALQRTVDGPVERALHRAALNQPALAEAAAVLVIAAVESRTAARYGARASRYVAFEAGAAAQNAALQAAALGLGCVVVGAFDDAAVSAAVRLPAGERALALMPLGWPA